MRFITFLIALFNLMPAKAVEARDTAYQFSFKSIDGRDLPLKAYEGKVILLVNTASHCGFTSQYKSLQALWETYKQKGLVVIAVPSSSFGDQEFDTNAEIKSFCDANYGRTFPMTDKTPVRGQKRHPFYAWAETQLGSLAKPRWNFHKYLIYRGGERVIAFPSHTTPNSPELLSAIEAALDSLPQTLAQKN